MNRMVEDLGSESRERDSTAPAVESMNARLSVQGPYRQDNIAAGSTTYPALDFNIGQVGVGSCIATPRAGRIVGLWVSYGTPGSLITQGSLTLSLFVAPAAGGAPTEGEPKVVMGVGHKNNTMNDLAAPVRFQKGSLVYIQIVASANLLPSGTLDIGIWPAVEWDPE